MSEKRVNVLGTIQKLGLTMNRVVEVIKAAPHTISDDLVNMYPALDGGILYKERHDYAHLLSIAEQCAKLMSDLRETLSRDCCPLVVTNHLSSLSIWKRLVYS